MVEDTMLSIGAGVEGFFVHPNVYVHIMAAVLALASHDLYSVECANQLGQPVKLWFLSCDLLSILIMRIYGMAETCDRALCSSCGYLMRMYPKRITMMI